MALLWMDGFDHGNPTNKFDGGELIDNNTGDSYARFYGGGISLSSGVAYLRKNLGVNKTTIYMGAAFKKNTVGEPAYNIAYPILAFYDEGKIYQIKIHLMVNNVISVYDGGDTLLGSTSDNVIADKIWYYIEVKVTISATVGQVLIRLNEQEVLNLTSKDTKYGSDYIRSVKIAGINSNKTVYWDDFYIDDAQFHGDGHIKVFMPDVDGNSSDFTRSTGSNDYECVDEIPQNEDTDYISSGTSNHKSIFGITTGILNTVKGIQVNNYCRIEQAGIRKITPIVRSNGTDYSGTETEAIQSEYVWESEIFEDDPDDSNVWDQTKLEAAEFGLEITT